MADVADDEIEGGTSSTPVSKPLLVVPPVATDGKENEDPLKEAQAQDASVSTALTRTQKKRAKAKAKATESKKEQFVDPLETPKIEVNETRDQMHARLLKGEKFDRMDHMKQKAFSNEEIHGERFGEIPAIPEDEVNTLLDDVSTIKELLLCRLLLSQAAVLPAALKARSVAEFLSDPEVSREDLRDLCLRVEQPQLQELRDACADLIRGDADEEDEPEDEEDDEQTAAIRSLERDQHGGKVRLMPSSGDKFTQWRSKHEEAVERRKMQNMRPVKDKTGELPTLVDFGKIEDGVFRNKRIRVKVCGRTIWNYPSDKAMARGGWLQYSVIAKGSRLEDSIVLCRNWLEFCELNFLAIYDYFPSASWRSWVGDGHRTPQLQQGLIIYEEFGIDKLMLEEQRTSRARARAPRAYQVQEWKNIVGVYVKRNEAVSRRFVQYLSMMSGEVCILVRDVKTGQILIKPPKEHLWIYRTKTVGKSFGSNGSWVGHREVGEELYNLLHGDEPRDWRFGFNDYYDVQVWDLEPGQPFGHLTQVVEGMWCKANRFCEFKDYYKPSASVLRTLTMDERTSRTRDARLGETNLYDVKLEAARLFETNNPSLFTPEALEESPGPTVGPFSANFYNDRDADEDMVLFPEETGGKACTAITDTADPIMTKLMLHGPSMKRFALELESDQDSDDFEDIDRELKPGEDEKQRKIINQKQLERSQFPPCPDEEDTNCECPECEWLGQQTVADTIPEFFDHLDHCQVFPEDFDEGVDDLALAERLKEFVFDDPYDERARDPETDWWSYVNREKSKVFKQQMHAAEFDSDAQERWRELKELIEEAKPIISGNRQNRVRCYKLLMDMGWHAGEHRRVFKDMEEAFATVSMFFHNHGVDGNSDVAQWKETVSQRLLLIDNVKKAAAAPYSHSPKSNRTMPNDFWVEIDKKSEFVFDCTDCSASAPPHSHMGKAPVEWDKLVRPLVAKLFKAGIIGPGYIGQPDGFSVVGTTPEFPQEDWYIDYRQLCDREVFMPSAMRNPTKIDLLATAERFAAKNPAARYTLLRIWTHSHFYPNTLGYEKRDSVAFTDCIGRSWAWTFIPKDMPDSEWSMQYNIDQRLARIKKHFGRNFEVKRDMVLVMAENEEKLPDLLTSIVFQLQTDPWRFEMDWWKSFVDVDLGFLAGLD